MLAVASPARATGNIVKSDLKGTWRISLHGLTDCGFATALATITFGTTGSGTGPLQLHGPCGTSTLPSQTLTVNTLAKNGEGTATLTCGAGCEWPFTIQVSPDRTKFNLVTMTPGSDVVEGLAILSSPADHIAVADLKGVWQFSAMGHELVSCGGVLTDVTTSAVGTMTLNATGSGTIDTTSFSTCGSGDSVGNTVTILGMNPDGSATAHVDCVGGGCAFDFSVQVSPDRSIVNMVTVSAADAGDTLSGVAIRRSTAGHITPTNLAGAWQGTLLAEDVTDGGVGTVLMTFKLNAKAASKKVTIQLHGSDGDGTFPDPISIAIQLNPDGSGTGCLTFAPETTCGPPVRLQVSPDRTIIAVTAVDPDSEDFATGLFIAQ